MLMAKGTNHLVELFLFLFLILSDVSPSYGRRSRTRRTDSLDDFDMDSYVPRFAQPLPNVTVTLDKDTVLPCIVDHLGNYKVAWVRVDTQTILTIHHQVVTRNPRITMTHSDHHFVLHIKNAQESDRGWYMCQINTDPMKSVFGFLEVVVPPEIVDKDSSTDMMIREGCNVTLTCKAKGHPQPYIMWRREDNQEIHYNGQMVNVIDGDIFQIVKVSRIHMGAYLCIASNGIPPSISKRIEVKVQFPPMMTIPHQLESAFVGQEVTLECHTEAYPKSINYWTDEVGNMLISGEKYESLLVEDGYQMFMLLKIRNISRHDFGTFKCVAKNSLGETDGNIKLYENPAPPTTTTVGPKPAIPTWNTRKDKIVVVDPIWEDSDGNKRPDENKLVTIGIMGAAAGNSGSSSARVFNTSPSTIKTAICSFARGLSEKIPLTMKFIPLFQHISSYLQSIYPIDTISTYICWFFSYSVVNLMCLLVLCKTVVTVLFN